ncbi:proline-rich receptor-like protein kinase PERK1 [Camellia sinensis]|uniref:proline-rich receptor-like protein kinase PERK1 n=1 Tax=Camellia sinensis TaxID=4442 RepID=UPI0010367A45|nr:proline-rich receptor-like protein kinase PERK1 [Camellia sinensis]
MARMVACAAACVRHSARCRPQMSQVVRAFEGGVSLSDLNEGIKPGHNTVYSSRGISDYDTSQYNEDMKKFRKMVLGTREDGSNENSALTNEYGLYPSSSSSGGQQTTREMEMGKMCGR